MLKSAQKIQYMKEKGWEENAYDTTSKASFWAAQHKEQLKHILSCQEEWFDRSLILEERDVYVIWLA